MTSIFRTLVVAALLTLVGSVAVADDALDLRSELDDNRRTQEHREQELEEVREQAGDARQRLTTAEAELASAEAALTRRREELAEAREELDDARQQAGQARAQLRRAQGRLASAERELTVKQEQLDSRVRAAFKYGQVSLAEAFMGTRDIADFLNSTTYVGHVMANDKSLVDEVGTLLVEVEEQRSEASLARRASEREARRAEAATEEVAAATRDQARLTEQVAERREAQRTALAALQSDAAAISEHLDDLQRSEGQVQSQIAEAERRVQERLAAEQRQREEAQERARREREASSNSDGGGSSGPADPTPSDSTPTEPTPTPPPVSNEGWLRPVNGRVSSGYGYRTHPVHGGQRLHAGVDLASPSGTAVRASRGGIVAFAGWMSGYGNTVMISHGDGLVTLYAHLSSYAVSRDASVQRGQSVGGVGMTGTATGPHLHFEVRVGGQPRDPCGYVAC